MIPSTPITRRRFVRSAAAGTALTVCPGCVSRGPLATAPLTFAVLGDTHYTAPEFKAKEWLHRAGDEIRAQHPEVAFVCHTGDVVEGGTYVNTEGGGKKFVLADYGQMTRELTFARDDLSESFGVPVFIAVGNHDKHDPGSKAFKEIMLARMAQQLGRPVTETYYAFRSGNACFLFLDFAPTDLRAQAAFAEETLQAARADGVTHLFAFAHFPLWVLARSGFYNPAFSESVLPLMKKYRVDAFFCGQTHNATACVRMIDGQPVTQIQNISTGGGSRLIPLEQVRSLLFPADESPYHWGFLEGLPMSYSIVRVEADSVRVQWHVLGQGAVREYGWREPGSLADIKQAEPPPRTIVSDSQLRQVTKAEIIFCPWAEQRTPITLTLNGEPVAQTQIGPAYNMFWDEQRLAIGPDKLACLRLNNRVEIGNPARAVFGLAHLRLEVRLADGTTAATPVCGDFAFSCRLPQAGKRVLAWTAAPRSRIREVDLGQTLPPMEVRFSQ